MIIMHACRPACRVLACAWQGLCVIREGLQRHAAGIADQVWSADRCGVPCRWRESRWRGGPPISCPWAVLGRTRGSCRMTSARLWVRSWRCGHPRALPLPVQPTPGSQCQGSPTLSILPRHGQTPTPLQTASPGMTVLRRLGPQVRPARQPPAHTDSPACPRSLLSGVASNGHFGVLCTNVLVMFLIVTGVSSSSC